MSKAMGARATIMNCIPDISRIFLGKKDLEAIKANPILEHLQTNINGELDASYVHILFPFELEGGLDDYNYVFLNPCLSCVSLLFFSSLTVANLTTDWMSLTLQ